MPRKRHSELTAGLFVIASVLLAFGVAVWIGAADLFPGGGQEVVFRVLQREGSVGVGKGTRITLGDAEVGRISRVEARPAEGACLYFGRLDRSDIEVRSDANAVVVSPPIGDAKIVLLSAGGAGQVADEDNPVALGGGLDQAMARINSMAGNLDAASRRLRLELEPDNPDGLVRGVQGIVAKVQLAAGKLDRFMASVSGEAEPDDPKSLVGKLHRSADDVNLATGSLALQLDANGRDTLAGSLRRAAGRMDRELDANAAGSLAAKAHTAADDVVGMVAETRPQLKKTMASVTGAAGSIETYAKKDLGQLLAGLREANTRILKTIGNFQAVSEQARQVVATNRDNIDETLDNLAFVSVNLKAASEEIRRNPWRLLYNPERKELRSQNIYAAVRSFADGAAQLDQAIAKLRRLKEVKSDEPEYAKAREEMLKNLKESFSKFNRVEARLWEELQK